MNSFHSKYIILIIFILNTVYIKSTNAVDKNKLGYIVPSSEQNYKNLINISNGINTFKYIFSKNQESSLKDKSDSSVKKLTEDSKLDDLNQQKQVKKSEEEKKNGDHSNKKENLRSSVDETNNKLEKNKDKDISITNDKESELNKEKSKDLCLLDWKVKFPFRPFAETARAVGIPAYSFHNNKYDVNVSFKGILDAMTLLELFYFDYDKIPISKPLIKDYENSWISKSLLSLIYKSENEDPLSFLMLSYGIVNAHWENYSIQQDIDTPELVVEDIQEYDTTKGDIIFK